MSTPTIEKPTTDTPTEPETYTLADIHASIETLRPIVGWTAAAATFAALAATAVGMTGYAIGAGHEPNPLRILAGIVALLLGAIAFRNLQSARRNLGAEQ